MTVRVWTWINGSWYCSAEFAPMKRRRARDSGWPSSAISPNFTVARSPWVNRQSADSAPAFDFHAAESALTDQRWAGEREAERLDHEKDFVEWRDLSCNQ